MRTKLVLALAAGAVAVPATAHAHLTADPSEAPAGSYAKVDFRVGHGCEGAPTTKVTLQIPDGVSSVRPEVAPGWKIETKEGKLAEPVESHGETITEGVREITWSGGSLPDEHIQDFGVSMKLPEAKPGQTLYFPAVQECPGGKAERWIQIPQDGEDPHSLDAPAPALVLTAAASDHGAGAGEREEASVDVVPAAAATDGGSDTLSVIALILGALGFGAGATGVLMARRARAA